MSLRNVFLATVLLSAIAFTASITHAQRGGNAGMSSMGGSGFSGGMLGGMSSSLGGTGGFGSGMSGFGSGMGGFGSAGMGGMGMGGSGMGGFGSGMGGSGMGGFGQSGMGINQQGNQGFIGRDSADMSAIFSELGRNSNQFMQQLNRTMRRGGGGRRNTSQEENAVPPVRVRLDVAFDQPTVSTALAATKVRGRMTTLFTRRNIAAPEVEVVGETVVLRGVVHSESQRLMIEKLALMEPGVYAVDNQMTVAEQPAPPATPPVAP